MEQAGGFECIGFCEIDKYAAAAYRAMYNTEGEFFHNDITRIDTGKMPDFDLFVGGFRAKLIPKKRISRKSEKKRVAKGKDFGKFGIKF